MEKAQASASRCLADQLARLVAEAVGAPNALISLIHIQRQIVLGSFGAGRQGAGPAEIAAERSLCDAVVAAGIPIIVSDAPADRRFADTAAVRKHGLGAYVGFPIRDADSHVVGVLAIGDHRPRNWTARQLTVIDDAAQLFTAGLAGEIDRHTAATAASQAPPDPAHEEPRPASPAPTNTDQIEAFTAALLTSLQTGVAACDRDGRLLLFNSALHRMLGLEGGAFGPDGEDIPPDEWPGRFHLHHPDGRPFAADDVPLRRALRGERLRGLDLLILAPGSRPRMLSVNGQPIVDASGDRIGAVITAEDITSRRRAEQLQVCELGAAQALADRDQLASSAVTALKAIGTCLGWPHAELWLADELGGTLNPVARWDEVDRAPIPRLPDHLDRGDGLAGTVWKTGRPLWVPDIAAGAYADPIAAGCGLHAALAVPIRSGGETIGVLAFFAGTTEEPESPLIAVLLGIAAQIGQSFEQRRAEGYAARLARSEGEYIALVCHELRTPLTSIAAYTELLKETEASDTVGSVRPLLDVVDRNTGLLLKIIENLLDLAELDSGQARLELAATDLSTIVREALEAFEPTAIQQGIRLHTRLPSEAILVADPERLRQMVDHLVDNALRYSPDGGDVEVTIEVNDGGLTLTIADNGIGIAEDELELVTRRLSQGSRSSERRIRGTGLGLAIANTILARHGGTLDLRAGRAEGTTVVARLPLHPPVPADA